MTAACLNTERHEIVSTRIFDASRERVFHAFRDPEQLATWWGPKGFTNTIREFNLRPGGAWRVVMHAPDGTDYANASVFTEVIEPERIVFQHLEPVHSFQMTITFADRRGRTELVWRMLFDAESECERVRAFIEVANEENFDRLEACVAKLNTAREGSERSPAVAA